jgi:hypothetical protein
MISKQLKLKAMAKESMLIVNSGYIGGPELQVNENEEPLLYPTFDEEELTADEKLLQRNIEVETNKDENVLIPPQL